ncbi:MAG: MraY family glycosyltransferase [Patescibacteria group bacterium]
MFFIFLLSLFVVIIIIPILIKVSQKTNFLVDTPKGDALKIHTKNIPLLGGLAMFLSVSITMIFLFGQSLDEKLVAIFLAMLPVFLLGFYDDLKWKHISTIKPLLKFFLLLVCTFTPSLILSMIGIGFNFVPVFTISVLLGFVYIFISINSINYQDGMDGLAGGQVFISLLGFAFLSFILGNSFALLVSLIFLGSVLAFLIFNFPPAKVFMGDSGAYSLGFILAVLAMLFSKPFNIYSVLGPVLIIGLPIFDGVYANIRRLVAGKSIFLGDRSHFYDKLLQKGFSTKKTLAVCYFLQILLVLIGIVLYQ